MSPRKSPQVPAANSSKSTELQSWRTIPNLITAARVLMIVPFTYYAANGQDRIALVIFFLAGLSDAIDGRLARWLNQMSKLGRLVDPVADKFLAGIAYVVLSVFRGGRTTIPMWVMGTVVARDVLILAGSWAVYRITHNAAFRPTVFGKLNTFIELLVIGWFLSASLFPALGDELPALYWLMTASILVSFTGYARQGVRMIRKEKIAANEHEL